MNTINGLMNKQASKQASKQVPRRNFIRVVAGSRLVSKHMGGTIKSNWFSKNFLSNPSFAVKTVRLGFFYLLIIGKEENALR